MRNKLLAVLLALCMVMALLPATVFADGTEGGEQPGTPGTTQGNENENKDDNKCSCGCDYGTTCTAEKCGCSATDVPKCSNADCTACKDKTESNPPVVEDPKPDPDAPKNCTCGCAFDCKNNCAATKDETTGKYVYNCGCNGDNGGCGADCKYSKCSCPCGKCEYPCVCSRERRCCDKCTCATEPLGDAPEGHCSCDDSTCNSPSHRGQGLNGIDNEHGSIIYSAYACMNMPEGDGYLCAACKAYADSKSGTAASGDAEPETPTQPSTPTGPTADPDAPQKAEDFSDVQPGQWYNTDLTKMLEKGWFIGQAGGKFAPQDPTTGAEVVVILSRVLGQDLVTTGPAWAAEATDWAAKAGLTDGIEITGGQLARQDLILMLWRAANKPESSYALSFSDIDGVSGDALTALRWAVEKGIVKGNGDGTVSPGGATKRCEMAALMVRYDAAVSA